MKTHSLSHPNHSSCSHPTESRKFRWTPVSCCDSSLSASPEQEGRSKAYMLGLLFPFRSCLALREKSTSYFGIWRRKWQPIPVSLPGKSHGQRSLAGYCPCGCKESDITEPLHFTLALMSQNVKEVI